ncbi:MAG: DUF4157 domain-containing protein [Oscillibacter sp.]|nr:DUF4157 domain-containing protein [Oscillibacter sp.]
MEYGRLQKTEEPPQQQKPNLTGIPAQTKWDLESRSGLSLDDVRVHYHSDEPAKLGALAYTQAAQVYIGPGQEGYLRHELGHVVQQKLGLVRPNERVPGGPALNTEESLERQADAIGAGAYFRPMPDAGVPLVQRCEDPVVQAAGRISSVNEENLDVDELTLPDAAKPTIVFEAMGLNVAACRAVYNEAQKYDGNTVCIFGLNLRTDPGGTGAEEAFTNEQSALTNYQNSCAGDARHLLYTFSFRWSPIPENVARGYPMPYVEARVLLMQKAEAVVRKLQGYKPDGGTVHAQYKFLYRWIDADAKDDTTKLLDASLLNQFADSSDAGVMTGIYHWRSEDPHTMAVYRNFLKEFNEAEKELREYYYLLRKRPENLIERVRVLQSIPAPGVDAQREITAIQNILQHLYNITEPGDDVTAAEAMAVESNDSLSGFYLPEPALMMNESAHHIMARSLPSVGSPDHEMNSALQNMDIRGNRSQDKESARLAGRIPQISDRISFQTALSVTKPLKNEFKEGTYWGSPMLNFLHPAARNAAPSFVTALKNVRQSAFNPGQWYFQNGQAWSEWETGRALEEPGSLARKQELLNRKRRELRDKLLAFLDTVDQAKTKLQRIREETGRAAAPADGQANARARGRAGRR